MPGLQEGFYVRCGCAAVCREGRAAADRTYNRTVASPGHGPDRSEPVEENQIKSEILYLKLSLPAERKSRAVYQGIITMYNLLIFSLWEISQPISAEFFTKQGSKANVNVF